MAATDTSDAAARTQYAVFGAMSSSRRVELSFEMAEQGRQISLAGIRRRHPHLDSAGVHREWLRLLHGDEVVQRFDEIQRRGCR